MVTISRFCLIKDYEDKYFATSRGDPVDVLHFAIESMGKSQTDLAALIGRNRASEILNRIRPLTLEMIRAISMKSKIPAETLTAEYELNRAGPAAHAWRTYGEPWICQTIVSAKITSMA